MTYVATFEAAIWVKYVYMTTDKIIIIIKNLKREAS